MIGQWVTSEEESAKLPLVWQILVHLLAERGETSDMAVNLSSAVAIKDCVDVSQVIWTETQDLQLTTLQLWELDVEYFLPYLEQTVNELYVPRFLVRSDAE